MRGSRLLRFLTILALPYALLYGGNSAQAEYYPGCGGAAPYLKWPTGKVVNFYVPQLPAGSGYETVARSVMAQWSEASAAKVTVTFGRDGPNKILWEDPFEEFANTGAANLGATKTVNGRPVEFAAATTKHKLDSSGCYFSSVTIYINKTLPWTTTYRSADLDIYGGKRRSFDAALMHEVGHALGLSHTNWVYNVMGDSWKHVHSNGITTMGYVGEFATDQLVRLYGGYTGTPSRDVAVSHYMYLGARGEYSQHTPAHIFDKDGTELNGGGNRFRDPYIVRRGQQVWVQFTYENLDSSSSPLPETPDIEFVLSKDNYIVPDQERSLGHYSIQDPIGTPSGLGRETPLTQKYLVTIPRDITPGQYWIGVILNENRTFAEKDYGNNATYLPIIIFRNSPIDPPASAPPPICNCPHGCQTNNTFCRVPLQTRALLNWWKNEPLRQMLLW